MTTVILVACCDFQGKTLWTFSEPSALKYQCSLSVDNNGNVFVAGAHSRNVIVIYIDGDRYRQLLSKKDGLDCPSAVEYVRTNNKLLVASYNGIAFVYDVV